MLLILDSNKGKPNLSCCFNNNLDYSLELVVLGAETGPVAYTTLKFLAMGILATATVLRDLTLVLNPSYEDFSPGSYEDILSSLESSLLSTQFVKIQRQPGVGFN